MAVLIISLFVIVVVWGWYLVPKRSGTHKTSTLNVRGRGLLTRSQPTPSGATPVGAPPVEKRGLAPVPNTRQSGAFTRRQRVRAVLAGAAVVSLAVALYTGSINWWWLHLAMDGLLILYYGLSLQMRENRGVRMTGTVPRYREESSPVLRRAVGG